MIDLEQRRQIEAELAGHGAFEVGFPWDMTRDMQLKWWDRYGEAALRYVAVRETLEPIIRSRPPDRFTHLGDEKYRHETIERRHTLFKTWPVKIIHTHIDDLLGMTWNQSNDMPIGVKIKVNGRTYTSEEDIAG